MKISIKSLNSKGRDAISQHVKESKSLKHKLLANRFFNQSVMNYDPYILLVVVKSPFDKMLKFQDVKPKLDEALQSNGATENDYIIEEVI